MLPQLIIAGVNKGGTTALFRYLAAHDEVCATAVKETCYFLPIRYGSALDPLASYEHHFSHCKNQNLRIESTPGYFYGAAPLAQSINELVPNVKIVLVFRDPVRRFFSFFHFMKAMQQINRDLSASSYLTRCRELDRDTLKDATNNPWFGLEGGKYADYLKPWIDTFGPRLRIAFFEDLTADPRAFLEAIADFAGIDPAPFATMDFAQENKTRGHVSPGLHALALWVYGVTAPVLNRHAGLKRAIAAAYSRVNEAAVARDPADETDVAAILKVEYAGATVRLREMLNGLPDGMVARPFPSWLVKSEEP